MSLVPLSWRIWQEAMQDGTDDMRRWLLHHTLDATDWILLRYLVDSHPARPTLLEDVIHRMGQRVPPERYIQVLSSAMAKHTPDTLPILLDHLPPTTTQAQYLNWIVGSPTYMDGDATGLLLATATQRGWGTAALTLQAAARPVTPQADELLCDCGVPMPLQ